MSLKALCNEHDYTLTKLSKETGISVVYLSEINKGKKINPGLSILRQIASCLNVTIDDVGNAISKESELIE